MTAEEVDRIDAQIDRAEWRLFQELESFLAQFEKPVLDWHFRRQMNNDAGVLQFWSSRNHRTELPAAIHVLQWLGEHGAGSYGLVYLHDDEDSGQRGADFSNEFRVWRLMNGRVEEMDDPFFSPIVPRIDPTPGA